MYTRASLFLCCLAAAGAITLSSTDARAQDCTPSRLMFVLDKSSSMQTGTLGGTPKWDIAVDALDQVAGQFQSQVELGLMMFPAPNQCAPGALEVEPALDTRDAMMAELASPPPTAGNWTPMAQTLRAAALEPSLQPSPTARYAVLITDGWQWCSPYDPATRFEPVDAVGDLNAAGVPTYIVGFGDSVDALTLNQVAVTAGTARAGCDPTGDTPGAANPCYYQADSPQQLIDALTEIVGEVSGTETCDGLDNDCDGEVDEDLSRSCATACGAGVEMCVDGGWTGCDAPEVVTEICDGVDNDCDGAIDPGCDCTPGEERACGGDDACAGGVQTCADDGRWGACEGDLQPQNEMCDGVDNDCDGEVDETGYIGYGGGDSLCPPGMSCENGSCEDLPPWTPTGDDEGQPAEGEVAGCGCRAGAGQGGGLGMLLLAAGTIMTLRRRRRS